MADAVQEIKKFVSKETLYNGGRVLAGLGVSEIINYGGDYVVRKLSKGKYKMPHEVGGVVTALGAGVGLKDPIIAAAGLGDAGLNFLWDVVGFNALDPVGSAKKLADKTTDASAQNQPGTSTDLVFAS